jgi:hypothetical protein
MSTARIANLRTFFFWFLLMVTEIAAGPRSRVLPFFSGSMGSHVVHVRGGLFRAHMTRPRQNSEDISARGACDNLVRMQLLKSFSM